MNFKLSSSGSFNWVPRLNELKARVFDDYYNGHCCDFIIDV